MSKQSQPDLNGNLASGSMWSIVDNLAQQVLSFLVFAVLARFLTPDAFGLLTVAHLFILFTRTVIFDAIAMPIVRAFAPNDRLYSWVFTCCSIAGLLLTMAMFFSAGLVSSLFHTPDLKVVLQGMSLSILFFALVRAYEAKLVRNMMFRQLAIRSIASVTIGGIIGITLAARGQGAISLVVQQVTASGLSLLLVVAQCRWLPSLVFDRVLLQRYWDDVRQVGMSGLLNYANANGDSLLVSILLGPYATGLYNLAKRVTSAVYLVISSSMQRVALPFFSDAVQNRPELQHRYLKIIGITLLCILPLFCFQGVLAVPLVQIVFGAQWLPAAPVIGALALLYMISSIVQLNDYLFFALGKNRLPVWLSIAQLTLAVASATSSSQFGLIGMSLSFCGAYLVIFPVSQWLLHRELGLNSRMVWFALAPPLVAGVVLLLGLEAYLALIPRHFTSLTLAGGTVIAGLLYPLAVALTGWRLRTSNASWHELWQSVMRPLRTRSR